VKRSTIIITAVAVSGIALIVMGQIISTSELTLLGLFVFSISGILIGIEAIKQRIFLEQSRYNRRYTETYLGFAAVLQGVLIIFVGLFLCSVAVIDYFNIGESVFSYLVRHPGIPLVLFGIYCLATAGTAIIGYAEQKQGPKWNVFLELIASRLLPGIILIVIALIAISLGVIEITAPEYFDKIGGGFLEILFKIK
jgi:hypothetical protein